VTGVLSQYFSETDRFLANPMIHLTLFGLGILIIDLMLPDDWKWTNALTALAGIGFSAFDVWRIQQKLHEAGQGFIYGFVDSLLIDRFAIYFFYLFLAGAAVAILMSVRYLEAERENHGEYYALLLFAVVGMMCMAAGSDVVLIFIGLELMAISTYVLVGFLRRDRRSNEAALKYLLLGAFSSGIFAYGLSLFYGLTGSTNLEQITRVMTQRWVQAGGRADAITVVALLTVLVGLFFKIAAIPFHQWAPDAYEGAPTSITGFMSVAVKAAAWAMLLRILLYGLWPIHEIYYPIIVFVSVASMTGANLAAITQNNMKRLLAYSSIAHVGYMLLGLVAMASSDPRISPAFLDGFKGILLYLMVYTFMNLGAFGVIASLRRRDIIGDELDDIAGLYSRAPVEAVLMLIFMLSLAGIPPLAGFYGKYFIFLSLIESGHYILAAAAVLYAVVGLYYYMKIANAVLIRKPMDSEPLSVRPAMGIALGVTAFATVFIGVFPNLFIQMVNWSLGLAETVKIGMLK
jgi:NADH-quinone oxidoreductase subunit N